MRKGLVHGSTSDTQLFRDVFDASPIGIAVENLDGQPLFVNPSFCSFLGFSQEEMRSKHCVDFSPPEDAQKDWELFQKLRAGSINHYQLEKRYFRRDGSLVWGRLSISLLKSRPSPLVIAMVEDITEQKRAEEARDRHAAIVESSEDAIASVTLDGVIASWNTGAQRIFVYSESEVMGKSLSILVPPELIHEENRILDTLRSGARIENLETVRVTNTGKRINVSLSISAIKDSTGKTVGYAVITRDITERKRHEIALRSSEERLRLAQQVASIGTFEWSIPTGVITWTPQLEAIYGLPVGGFGGTQADFETLVHPDDRAQLLALNDWALKTGLPTRGEWRAVWPSGSVHWIAGHWQAFMDEYGKPLRIIGVNADITERKLAEQALAGMTRKLVEAQEQERTRIARELHDDVTQRLALLAIKLHQLQENPLEIQSRAQELNKEIAAISTDVQSLSHDLHSSHLEYLGVVAAMKGWCREFGERYGMQVDYKHDVQGILPREIGLCLFRVLQEALNNTAKHSGANRIEVRLQTETDEIHLIIDDRGKGFEVEPALQGRGLGLTSMRERVRLVNGTFSIQSKPMNGTTIHVRVPLLQAHETQRKAVRADKGTVVA